MAAKSIVEAITNYGKPQGNNRVYRVKGEGEPRYVVSNSQGQVALKVVEVTAVSAKEVNEALVDAMLEKQTEPAAGGSE